MKEMNLVNALINKNDCISEGIFSMFIHATEITKIARAGQFIMVYLNNGELLLPRPISICQTFQETGVLQIVYQVAGNGTKVMSEMKPGQEIKILGALGNGFEIKKHSRVALVGGGIGTPPLLMLAKKFAEQGTKVDAFFGFRSKPILIEEFRAVTDNIFIATEDGSSGHHGYITEIFKAENYDEILACGPLPLLRVLSGYSNVQICMEQRMACGIGTCVGCVIKVGGEYVRVCSEGPVFNAAEVNFDD